MGSNLLLYSNLLQIFPLGDLVREIATLIDMQSATFIYLNSLQTIYTIGVAYRVSERIICQRRFFSQYR